MAEEVMSNGEANKVIRVLTEQRLKYTVQVHLPDRRVIEWQANENPSIKYNDEARALWLCQSGYVSQPIMAWPEGAILLVEENPKA